MGAAWRKETEKFYCAKKSALFSATLSFGKGCLKLIGILLADLKHLKEMLV